MEIQAYDDLDIFKENISSFKETSRDSDGDMPGYMTNSEIQVINFDKVKESYIREMNLSNIPCSNDALYIGKDRGIVFVEFKNGVLKKSDIFNVYNKIYDSLLIFNDIVGENITFCRQNLSFILVYNERKNTCETNDTGRQASSKAIISKYIHNKAKKKFVRFGLDRFEKIYFKEVYTYTQNEFEEIFLAEISNDMNKPVYL